MAENDGMEEKDLAKERKEQAKQDFLESVKDIKEGCSKVIETLEAKKIENGEEVIVKENLVVTKKNDQYLISIQGTTFAIANKDGNFIYMNKLTELENRLKKENEEFSLKDLGLPGLDEALDREEQAKKQEQQQEEKEEVENHGEEQEAEVDDEKPDLEDNANEENDKQKEEIAKQYNVNARQVIHISKNKKITERNFGEIAKWSKDYEDIYIVPGKDEYSRKFIGVNKGNQEEIEGAQKQLGGKNPNVLIKRIDGQKIEEIRPICMYELDDKSAIAIVKDQYGRPEALYCRQQGGEGKVFWGTLMPEANGKNVDQQEPETRKFMDYHNNSNADYAKKADAFERQQDLEKRGVPSKENGVQLEEINGTPKQNRDVNVEDIAEYLMSRDGIVDKLTVPPGFYENKAKKVLNLMENDKTVQFEEAVEQVEKDSQKEPGGRTPGEPNKDKRWA